MIENSKNGVESNFEIIYPYDFFVPDVFPYVKNSYIDQFMLIRKIFLGK